MKPTGAEIQDIVSQVKELTWSYSIWWEIVNKTNRIKYNEVLETYPNFFTAAFCSMQQGMLVIIARLFDQRGDALSLTNLIARLESTDLNLAKQLALKVSIHRAFLEKCKKLRHKVYGHRDAWLTPEQAFKTFPVKPGDFKVLIGSIQQIVSALAQVQGINSKQVILDEFERCERDAAEETKLIMQRLQTQELR